MTKPVTVISINGALSYEDAEAKRNKIMHKDLYGLYCIYVDEKTELWVTMPLKALNAMTEFRESEEAKQNGMTDPYASEAKTRALIQPDQRSDAEKKLDAMLEERGAWEQGTDAYPILYQIAVELLK